jgi:RNA polymerase sigma-70 factor (ECF subfamily)
MTFGVNDEDLMRRVAVGDRAAFSELVQRHRGQIMRLVYGIVRSGGEAEDIVQETFIRIWTKACDWNAERGTRFVAWTARIAINLAIDGRRRRTPDQLGETQDFASTEADAEEQLMARQIGRRIDQAMLKLPERQRTAFVLCQIEELTGTEAARCMGVSTGSLEQLLVRARRRLRRELADLVED